MGLCLRGDAYLHDGLRPGHAGVGQTWTRGKELQLAVFLTPAGLVLWCDRRVCVLQCDSRGELLVSLSYQPVSHRLSVVVLKARHLPKMDMTGLSASE